MEPRRRFFFLTHFLSLILCFLFFWFLNFISNLVLFQVWIVCCLIRNPCCSQFEFSFNKNACILFTAFYFFWKTNIFSWFLMTNLLFYFSRLGNMCRIMLSYSGHVYVSHNVLGICFPRHAYPYLGFFLQIASEEWVLLLFLVHEL